MYVWLMWIQPGMSSGQSPPLLHLSQAQLTAGVSPLPAIATLRGGLGHNGFCRYWDSSLDKL